MSNRRRGYQEIAVIYHSDPPGHSYAALKDGSEAWTQGPDEAANAERLLHMVAALMEGCYQ